MSRKKNPAAVALGRIKSPAKTRAARMVGKKFGGRKPKFAVGDQARANDQAPGDYRGRIGTIDEIGPGKSEFGVKYSDGKTPDRGHLYSWWLDREDAQ